MRAAWVALVVSVIGCSASKSSDPTPGLRFDAGANEGGFTIDDASGFSGDAPPITDAISASDCAEENKQIYVVTQENDLHRFAPETLAFTKVGALKCPASLSTPFSMAVDRKGTAWVLYSDGRLYKVSTKDASCSATTFKVGQEGFSTFGMAYVADAPGSAAETLYVADYNGKGIAKIDSSSLVLSFVGAYGSGGGAGELTGRGDARLFAFFNATPTRVAEIDRTTGKIMTSKNVTGTLVGSGWAFAHWGGEFWLFTAPSGTSQVTRYDFTTGTSSVAKSGLGFVIVGAGVSTCAPTERPK